MSTRIKLILLIPLLSLMTWLASPRPTYANRSCADTAGTSCGREGSERTCELPDGSTGFCICERVGWLCTQASGATTPS